MNSLLQGIASLLIFILATTNFHRGDSKPSPDEGADTSTPTREVEPSVERTPAPTPEPTPEPEPTPTSEPEESASPSSRAPTEPAPTETETPIAVPSTTTVEDHGDEIWDKVAYCESLNRWGAHPSDYEGAFHFFGGLQFTQQAWEGVGGTAYAPRADLATKAEQIAMARRVLAINGPTAWPNCGPKAGLNTVNGRADRNAVPEY